MDAEDVTGEDAFIEAALGPEHAGKTTANRDKRRDDAPDSEDLDDEEVQSQGDDERGDDERDNDETQADVKASDDSDTDEPDYVELEVDGEVLQVPPKYKDYFMRQQDYTQKTQEVAQQRKQAEAVLAQVEQERQKYQFLESVQDDLNKAEKLKAQIEQVKQYKRDQLDNLDLKDLVRIDAQVEEWNTELNSLGQSLQTRQQEFQQAQQQSLKELLDKSTEALKSRIPNWGAETQKQVRDFALSNGFTEQELNNVYDPRYVEVLYKAAQYDALKKGAAVAVKKVQDAPTIKAKPRNPMPADVRNKLDLKNKLKSPKRSNKQKAELIGDSLVDFAMGKR